MSQNKSLTLSLKDSISLLSIGRFRAYLVPFISGVLCLILGLLVIKPSISNISLLLNSKKSLEAELASLTGYNDSLKSYTAYFSDIQGNYQVLEQAIPLDDDIPFLMTQVQQIASSSGVLVNSLQYSGGSKSSLEDTKAVNSSAVSYGRVRLAISGAGSPATFLSFCQNIEKASRLLDIDTFRYSYSQEDNSVSFNLGLVSYYLPPSKAAKDFAVSQISALDLKSPEVKEILEEVKSLKYYDDEN